MESSNCKIVNADDLGYSQAVNDAIFRCFELGIIQRASIMVNAPKTKEAVQRAKELGVTNKIGLHLVIDEKLSLEERRASIRQQMEQYMKFGFKLMHVDSHLYAHTHKPTFYIVLREARRHAFRSMRAAANLPSVGWWRQFKAWRMNRMIRRHFITTDYFGSARHYRKTYRSPDWWAKKGSVEVMIHPDFRDGKLVDMQKWGEKEEYEVLE